MNSTYCIKAYASTIEEDIYKYKSVKYNLVIKIATSKAVKKTGIIVKFDG